MNPLRAERKIPDTAWAIIVASAAQYEVADPESLLASSPRDPEIKAARAAAMTRLTNEELDGRPRYPVARLQEWFGVSRASVNRQRAKSPEYAPRRVRK